MAFSSDQSDELSVPDMVTEVYLQDILKQVTADCCITQGLTVYFDIPYTITHLRSIELLTLSYRLYNIQKLW